MKTEQNKIRDLALKLNKYPVSPFFTAKVLNNAILMSSNSVWDYMQIFSTKRFRGVMLAMMMVIFVVLVQMPASNDDISKASNTTDYSYLIQDDSPVVDINNNDQALLFALSN